MGNRRKFVRKKTNTVLPKDVPQVTKVMMSKYKKIIFCISLAFSLHGIIGGAAYAIEIVQITPQQVPTNSAVNIAPSLASGQARWSKLLGPDWLSVDSLTGALTGTSDSIKEAHYIQIKASGDGQSETMTFILVVGDQNIIRMNGVSGNPSDIKSAYSLMNAGDVLLIPDGVYSGINNTINGSTGDCIVKNGAPDNYTTLIAENPNAANLPSAYHKGGEYIAYKGLEFNAGITIDGDLRFDVRSNHIKVMLCSSRANGFGASYGAAYILFEDCFAYGDSRAVFRIGSTGNESNHIIFRRCTARHDLYSGIEPTATFMHYGGNNVLFQNCLDIDQAGESINFASANGRYGSWETKNGSMVYIKDSFAINVVDGFHYGDSSTTNTGISNSVFWDAGTGNTSLSPSTVYDRLTIGDVNAQNTENTFTDRSSSSSVYFTNSIFYDIEGTGTESGYRSKTILYECPESSNNLFYPIQPDLTIGDTTDIITGINPVTGNPGNGNHGIIYPIRIEQNSDAAAYGVGATIEFRRGRSGTLWGEQGYDELTSDPLWPWPNEIQIKEKMSAYSYNSDGIVVNGARGFCSAGKQLNGIDDITLTSYIWEYLGNQIPEEIYSYGGQPPDTTPPAAPGGITVE